MAAQGHTAAGVDVGGTFTDTVAVDGTGAVHARKVPTTTADQSTGVVHGVGAAAGWPPPAQIAHGTTTATNAVLEHRVARATLVVTAGFADVLAIGRQDRPSLYDLAVTRPAPLIPPDRVVTVDERLTAEGGALVPLTAAERERVVAAVAATEPESVAISLLFGFADDSHERELAAALRAALHAPVTVASELLPEFREYERTSTCAMNAAVAPVMVRYLSRLEGALGDAHVSVMTSGGGTAALDVAAEGPAHTLLSGPAAGVVAAAATARRAGYPDAMAFDMSGTSTDVCLIAGGEPQRRSAGDIGGRPFNTPITAVHTVGAGGGSLAWLDAGGALRVGPRSAGAVPGPACYGRGGTQPTVTDAHAALGHLAANASFGSGSLTPDPAAAHAALATLTRQGGDGAAAGPAAQDLGARTADPAGDDPGGDAAGVLTVVRATMARALRGGVDRAGRRPGGLGAGRLRRCRPAARLCPCPGAGLPGGAGARRTGRGQRAGAAAGPPRAESSRTVMATLPARPSHPAEAMAGLTKVWEELADDAEATLARQGVAGATRRWLADLRYAGQSHELRVEVSGDVDATGLRRALHRAHAGAYGYHVDDGDVDVVTLRAAAEGEPMLAAPPVHWDLGEAPSAEAGTAAPRTAPIGLADGSRVEAAIVDRASLATGEHLRGPALVRQPDATTLLEPGDQAHVDAAGTLVVSIGRVS